MVPLGYSVGRMEAKTADLGNWISPQPPLISASRSRVFSELAGVNVTVKEK